MKYPGQIGGFVYPMSRPARGGGILDLKPPTRRRRGRQCDQWLRVFKLLDLEDENGVAQNNPSTNGSSVTTVSDPIYGTVWRFYKAVNDLRCEAHGANGVNPAIGQTYYIGWRSKLTLPTVADLNAIFQWKAYGEADVAGFPHHHRAGRR